MESENKTFSPQKRQKCSDDDDNDRISQLPESVITYILSLLPTKYAVATKYLSEGWENRWTELTSFNFDEEDWPNVWKPEKMNFEEFINWVFLNSPASIQKLRLRLRAGNPRSNYLKLWVRAAMDRDLQVLDVSTPIHNGYYNYLYYLLPAAIYTCETLVCLRLSGGIQVKPPRSVFLPKLTVLELNGIKFESEETVFNLISGCPELESLTIATEASREDNENVVVFKVRSKTLKRLRFSKHVWKPMLKLQIDAPSLEYMYLCDDSSNSICIEGLTSVNEVELDVHSFLGWTDEVYNSFLQYLRGHVKNLRLSEGTMRAFSETAE